jgi:hypothetical protein
VKPSDDHEDRALPRAAGNTMDARGGDGLWEGQRQQDGGQTAGQPRLARSRWTQEREVMVRTPAFASCSPRPRGELSTRGCWPSAVPVMPQPLGSTDHLVGLEDERWRDGQPQRFGRLQVDDAREGRKLFHRQVGRRGALFETVIAEGPGRRVNPGYRPKRITTFMAYRSWRVLSK